MSTEPTTGTPHPLVAAYLADLDRALVGADPQERLDTLAAVDDHIAEALAEHPNPTPDAVRRVLAELGTVEQIAADATPAPAAATRPTSGSQVPSALLIASIVALALIVVVPWLAAALALGCLITALALSRHDSTHRRLLRAAMVISGLALVTTAVLAAFLLTSSSDAPTTPAMQTAQPAQP